MNKNTISFPFKKKQTFWEAAQIVDEAGDIMKRAGFKDAQVYETQGAFLALTMVESRLVRDFRKKTLDAVLSIFNEYGKKMIQEGLKVAQVNQLTDQQIIDVANEFNTHCNFFGQKDMDAVLTSLLTYAAYAIKNTKTEEEIAELRGKGYYHLADFLNEKEVEHE